MMGRVGTCGMGCVCISESECVHGCVSQGEMMSTLSPVRSTDAQGTALPHHPLGGERRVMCCVGACAMGCLRIWGVSAHLGGRVCEPERTVRCLEICRLCPGCTGAASAPPSARR